MKVLKVDHIGIAVNNIEESLKFYSEILGLDCHGIEVAEDHKVKVAFLPCGDSELQLMEATASDGAIAKFIENSGGSEGIQHIALRVENIEAAIAYFKEKGIVLIDKEPRYGAGGARIAFLHPNSTKGVLLELSER
jgi:methylmalonyl-CoA/ethylmalonyl-CoA epimerase